MEELNEIVQDAKSLLATAKDHAANGTEEGISQEDIQSLTAVITDTQVKNKDQQNAVQAVSDLTDAQNKTMERSRALIRKVQTAARGAYGEDNKQVMKEFHIGSQAISTVKGMMSELKYMSGVAVKRLADLSKSGLKQGDIEMMDQVGTELDDTDSRQENAKKKQKSATQVRDKSMVVLRKTMKRIRNRAKVIFEDQPSVLTEFKSIMIKRSAKKQEPTPPVIQTSKGPAA